MNTLTDPKRIEVSDYWRDGIYAAVNVWPIGSFAHINTIADRADVTIRYGHAALTISPTAADLDALIAALQWARERCEVAV